MRPMLQAILFDLDLTLGRPVGDLSFEDRQAHLYASVGLPYTPEQVKAGLAARREAIALGQLRGVAGPQRQRDLLTAYRQVLAFLGYTGDRAEAARRLYEGYAHLPFQVYDDARPTLTRLAQAGFRLGIVSNHTPAARPVIEAHFGDLVPSRQMVISGEEGVHKPRPTLFRRAAARMRTPPGHCAFVGDNLAVDAQGALAAGYRLGIWVDREGHAALDLPDSVVRVTRLAEIPPLVEALRESSKE